MDQPIIFVSIQYRLAHFGFSASREFEEAGLTNLGFEDQRNALRWIQNNIEKVRPASRILFQHGVDGLYLILIFHWPLLGYVKLRY